MTEFDKNKHQLQMDMEQLGDLAREAAVEAEPTLGEMSTSFDLFVAQVGAATEEDFHQVLTNTVSADHLNLAALSEFLGIVQQVRFLLTEKKQWVPESIAEKWLELSRLDEGCSIEVVLAHPQLFLPVFEFYRGVKLSLSINTRIRELEGHQDRKSFKDDTIAPEIRALGKLLQNEQDLAPEMDRLMAELNTI